ncbi:hypothetical protein ADEAN_000765500 [Angomonas deanei]|uniref:Uncharacterized protein n=1 Tax=Angomonas deanei TaxID=59799 RepID=A0A7G2CJV2_9TRYP|nr:hypothetical protein ADEAN_000765500 [Angomonas deanei]
MYIQDSPVGGAVIPFSYSASSDGINYYNNNNNYHPPALSTHPLPTLASRATLEQESNRVLGPYLSQLADVTSTHHRLCANLLELPPLRSGNRYLRLEDGPRREEMRNGGKQNRRSVFFVDEVVGNNNYNNPDILTTHVTLRGGGTWPKYFLPSIAQAR